MKKLLQNIVAIWHRKGLRRSSKSMRRKGLADGFTLIELLVASLIASFLVVVLLSFLIGVLDSDRKETAKSNAQEELQAAISYIADDLQEATYIYGSDALAAVNSQLPHNDTGTTSECNNTNCTPILVFWKRYNYNPNSTGKYSNTSANPSSRIIGCMPYKDTPNCDEQSGSTASKTANPYQTAYGRDTYTTSLVAYYLKNDNANTNETWSKTARILRWEIKDGYVAYCSNGGAIAKDPVTPGNITSATDCPAATNLSTRADSTLITTPVALSDSNVYFILPSQGFNRLDLSASGVTLSSLAGAWKKFADFDFNADKFVTLVDFMDDTAYAANQGGGSDGIASATAAIKIPVGLNDPVTPSSTVVTKNTFCDDPSIGVGNADPTTTVTQRIPNQFDNSDGSNPSKLSSFYACVAPDGVSGSTVRIFLRGNAIARLTTPVVPSTSRLPNDNNIAFFPTADVRVFGRSAIGIKTK